MSFSAETPLESAARVAALFGAPARARIIQLLAQAPRSVDEIAQATGESVANASQHLKKLLQAGLLEVERKKLSRIYRLSDERLALVLDDLFDIAEKLAPRRSAPSPRTGAASDIWNPHAVATVLDSIRDRRSVLLDVRELHESLATPIEGSVRIPLEELRSLLPELAKSRTYYLICSGRACPKATAGVELLRKKGFKAFRLKESPAALRLDRQALWDETTSVDQTGRTGRR